MELLFLDLRMVLLLVLFGVASVYYYKSRRIPDALWIVSASIGGILYIFDYSSASAYHVMSFFTSCFFGFMLYRFKFVGMADFFATVSISIILPVHYEFVMMPIAVTVLGLILVVISVTLYNVILNTIDFVSKRRSPFENFPGESFYRKFLAFFCMHKKRDYEKFVILSERYHYSPIIPKNRSFMLVLGNNR